MKKCCGGTIPGGGGGGGGSATQYDLTHKYTGGTNCSAYEVSLSLDGGVTFSNTSTKLSGNNPIPVMGTAKVYDGDTIVVRVEALAPTTVACQQNFNGSEITVRVGNDPLDPFNNPLVMTVVSPNVQDYTFTFLNGVRDSIHVNGAPVP